MCRRMSLFSKHALIMPLCYLWYCLQLQCGDCWIIGSQTLICKKLIINRLMIEFSHVYYVFFNASFSSVIFGCYLTLSSHRMFLEMPRFPDSVVTSLKKTFLTDKLIWSTLYAFFLCFYAVIRVYWLIPSFNIFNHPFHGKIKIHEELFMLEANVCHHGCELRNSLRWNWKMITGGERWFLIARALT